MVKCLIKEKDVCVLAKPEVGDIIETRFGKEKVVDVWDYDKATEGMTEEERKEFDTRVEFFLGDKKLYFEFVTELIEPKPEYKRFEGEYDIHDWSKWPGNFPRKR